LKKQSGLVPEKAVILNSPVDMSNEYGDVVKDKSVVPAEFKSV
jgi:hypothetical protein